MKSRIFEAEHTTAPDHMPERNPKNACIQRGVHTRPVSPPFSSFAYQTLDLHRRNTVLHAATNIVVSLVLGLLAFALGIGFGSLIAGQG